RCYDRTSAANRRLAQEHQQMSMLQRILSQVSSLGGRHRTQWLGVLQPHRPAVCRLLTTSDQEDQKSSSSFVSFLRSHSARILPIDHADTSVTGQWKRTVTEARSVADYHLNLMTNLFLDQSA